jgi:hypothetical protein
LFRCGLPSVIIQRKPRAYRRLLCGLPRLDKATHRSADDGQWTGLVPVVSRARMEVPHASAVPRERGRDSRERTIAAHTPDLPSLRRYRAGVAVVTAAVAARPRVRVFAGSPHQVRHVRDFVGRAVAGCPVAGDVVLLASEVATNAIVHTASGAGGSFTVAVCQSGSRVRVEVLDGGSAKSPVAHAPGCPGESGSGLVLVGEIAARWGHSGGQHGRVVWFEVEW